MHEYLFQSAESSGKIWAIGKADCGSLKNEIFFIPYLTQADLLLIHQPFNDGKSAAQTALRFLLQSNVVVIPKSTHKERMEQNFDVFDFALSAEDMTTIQGLDEGESLFFSHYDPATVEMITGLHR